MTRLHWILFAVGAVAVGGLAVFLAMRPPATLQEAALQAARTVGVPDEWVAPGSSLWSLLRRESALNPRAQNPSSTAYGLFQFLNSTWVTVGATKTDDPYSQFVAGLRYIQKRYGNPDAAWEFWKAQDPHWY